LGEDDPAGAVAYDSDDVVDVLALMEYWEGDASAFLACDVDHVSLWWWNPGKCDR
jgi:hypothetical protein